MRIQHTNIVKYRGKIVPIYTQTPVFSLILLDCEGFFKSDQHLYIILEWVWSLKRAAEMSETY